MYQPALAFGSGHVMVDFRHSPVLAIGWRTFVKLGKREITRLKALHVLFNTKKLHHNSCFCDMSRPVRSARSSQSSLWPKQEGTLSFTGMLEQISLDISWQYRRIEQRFFLLNTLLPATLYDQDESEFKGSTIERYNRYFWSHCTCSYSAGPKKKKDRSRVGCCTLPS